MVRDLNSGSDITPCVVALLQRLAVVGPAAEITPDPLDFA
jgi:hypothetical protein